VVRPIVLSAFIVPFQISESSSWQTSRTEPQPESCKYERQNTQTMPRKRPRAMKTLQRVLEYNRGFVVNECGSNQHSKRELPREFPRVLFARMGPPFITTGALSSRVSRRHRLISYNRFNHLLVYLAAKVSFRSGLVSSWLILVWRSLSYRQKLLLPMQDPAQPRSPPRPALSLLSNARITLLAFSTVPTRSGTFIRGDVTRMIPG